MFQEPGGLTTKFVANLCRARLPPCRRITGIQAAFAAGWTKALGRPADFTTRLAAGSCSADEGAQSDRVSGIIPGESIGAKSRR
jgi:hypothetical protein